MTTTMCAKMLPACWLPSTQTTSDLKLSDIVDLDGTFAGSARRGAKSFFAYTGSLTEPPCTEGIQWFLQEQVQQVSTETIEMLWNHIHAHPGNSRPVQNRNGASPWLQSIPLE